MTAPQSPQAGEFLLYETEDGRTRVECRFIEDSLWLTQALMADLFQVKVPTIKEHLKTLYAEGEIQPEATIRNFLIVRQEGARQVSRNKMTRQAIQYALGLSNRATGQPGNRATVSRPLFSKPFQGPSHPGHPHPQPLSRVRGRGEQDRAVLPLGRRWQNRTDMPRERDGPGRRRHDEARAGIIRCTPAPGRNPPPSP